MPVDRVPKARVLGLVVTRVDDDVLVYVEDTHQMHHLNPAACAVWERCDGTSTIARVINETRIAEQDVRTAITRLAALDLLESSSFTGYRLGANRYQRRKLIAIAGAASIPVIKSLTAPTAALAMSGSDAACNDECERHSACSGCCNVCNLSSDLSSYHGSLPEYRCYNPTIDFTAGPYCC
jgi:hypothetical protein